jgi:AcrR family transcriptional regulator
MVRGAAQMIAERGIDATSLRELAEQAQVPLGSTYHHFPGGKAELVDEAVTSVGRRVGRLLDSARENGPERALEQFAELWREVLRESDFHAGCPVLAAATARDERHHEVARSVFAHWHASLVSVLEDAGVGADRAPGLATLVVAGIEGAVGLARASGSTDPLDQVVAELRRAVREAVGAA